MRYIISLLLTSLAAPALAQVPSVVTDIPPVHSLVAAVMGDLGEPVLLLEPGASEHHFQLRPSQAAQIAGADLVVQIGPELTPWLEKALQNRAPDAPLLTLLGTEGTYLRDYAGQDDGAGHDEDHDHDGHAEHEEHEEHDADDDHDAHDHGGIDPHAWLNAENARRWVDLIATQLALLDPENARVYGENATRAMKAIRAADIAARETLAPLRDRPFVTFHDAYGYFTARYGMEKAGAVSLGDATAPGAKRMADLRHEIEEGGILCLFPEAQHDPALIAQLADGTGARIGGTLDPVGSTLVPGPALYPALLTGTAATLADCLSQ